MNLIISGYGRMGHAVEKAARAKGWTSILPTNDLQSVDPERAADAFCIDFSTPDAFRRNYNFLAKHFRGVVVGTTGWNHIQEEVFATFKQAGTPLIHASNFSIGVNLLFEITATIGQRMKHLPKYQTQISETHHIHKLDQPSGTAKTLAEILKGYLNTDIGISSIREGTVTGIHEIRFTNTHEQITLAHEAFSRDGFAEGAVWAAEQLPRINGIHEFRELLFQQP